jgi:hypothetical protein
MRDHGPVGSGDSLTCIANDGRIICVVRAPRLWPGLLSILLLCCIGFGLVSAALPDDANDPGYYDGDGDDAVVAPERLAALLDMAIEARVAVISIPTPEASKDPALPTVPLIDAQSPPPLLRSPPLI